MKITLLEFTLFKTTYKLSINAKMPIMVGVLTFISRINTKSGQDKSIVLSILVLRADGIFTGD